MSCSVEPASKKCTAFLSDGGASRATSFQGSPIQGMHGLRYCEASGLSFKAARHSVLHRFNSKQDLHLISLTQKFN